MVSLAAEKQSSSVRDGATQAQVKAGRGARTDKDKERDKPAGGGRGDGQQGHRMAQDSAELKDHKLGDCLGKGAFGSVYRGLNLRTGETVAVKQIRMADLPRTELRVIMLEIDLLKNLNHPNIVKYHGFEKNEHSLYIILEYCENGSLHSICKNFGRFPESLVALYMSQVLHGLLYLHEQGVIHRDIKGANILTTKEGLVKLADFGVATKASGIHESSVVGTPYWMAPEVIELSGATTASDIWSLGCTVIELLDGKPPYHKLQPMPALFRIVNDDHPPLPEGASPAARDFLMQCFQKDPNLRVSARKLLKHPWIVNAKRTDAVVPTKPTKYDEAVKNIQQYNEKLKSPDQNSLRRAARQKASNAKAIPVRKDPLPPLATSGESKAAISVQKTRPNADMFRSPDADADDNWDADFFPISPNGLHLPLKTHDNFAGLLSSDKLKAYAKYDALADIILEDDDDDDDDDEDSSSTVKTPVRGNHHDPEETVRPFTPGKPGTSSGKNTNFYVIQRQTSQPKTQILRTAGNTTVQNPTAAVRSKLQLTNVSTPTSAFRENAVEDYSDLVAADDAAFQRKIHLMQAQDEDSFTPKLFHPSDLKSGRHSVQARKRGNSGSSNRRQTPTSDHGGVSLERSRSSLEIQKYAEDEDEDFSDIFGKDGDAFTTQESDSGSERSTLMMLSSKLLLNNMGNSWIIDEEDEDDPFAQLDQELNQADLESNVARDRHARLCKTVESLVGSLNTDEPSEVLDLSLQLIEVLAESPDLKSVIISSHGMLPMLEILERNQPHEVNLQVLKIINMITYEDGEILENLCFVGGIPIISRFASKKCPTEVRLEAAAFVRQVYQTSILTLQMFISCGGLNVLVEFLEEVISTDREHELVLVGVTGLSRVFELQGPTPKNDFCRILTRSGILNPLSIVLTRIISERDQFAEVIEGRIVNIFLLFSQAENYVKEVVADRRVLQRVLKNLKRMTPNHQITMLKFLKNLSMLATTHDSLQNSNAIEVLTDLLESSMKLPQFREISNQVLNILYNLCRLSKARQEDAAENGLIPLLQHIVHTEWPLKEFALPILCDMAHSGKVGRGRLWQHNGLQFYLSLLGDRYWQVTALDAICIWLETETAKVEKVLTSGPFGRAIVECFTNPDASADAFENLLEPLQKMLHLSPPVAACLAHRDIFMRTAHKLNTNRKAVVRKGLLNTIRLICDASEERGVLLRKYGLYDVVARLSEQDPAILVRNIASDLLSMSNEGGERRNVDGTRVRPLRRVSSTTLASPSLLHSIPLPPTPQRSTPTSGSYFDLPLHPQVPIATRSRASVSNGGSNTPISNSYRPGSRDSSSSHGSSGWPTNSGAPIAKSRLPRTSGTRLARLSVDPQQRSGSTGKEENVPPTSTPMSSAPRSTSNLSSRRRRQTSLSLESRARYS